MTVTPNDPNSRPGDIDVYDEYRQLQIGFAKHLNTRLNDTENPPSHQELAVIRAALRDNGMTLRGPPPEWEEKERLRREGPDGRQSPADKYFPPEWDDDDDDFEA